MWKQTSTEGESPEFRVKRFQSFIDEKLKPDLKQVLDTRDKLYQRISDYQVLGRNIELLQQQSLTKLKTQVDLGHQFYVQAVVPDASNIFVNVGLGFCVELTLQEALVFIPKKEVTLQSAARQLTEQAAAISSQIRMVQEGIAEVLKLDFTTIESSKNRRNF
eukprot:gb/GEZN01020793.1/.p1 GENE.gb/GEZN01020793.1/~~gb/GEZN01020793.1/.p1  ORF type:complete len:162 (+),score=26.50 gb/GEZN01020793.1/:166-651(+)